MNCLHISFNEYPSVEVEHATKQIWKELQQDFDEYHVLGRSDDNKFHTQQEGKLWLHRMPKGRGNKIFAVQQFLLPYYIKKYKIDFMITQCCLLGGVAGILCSKFFGIPILVEIHGKHYFDIMDSKALANRFLAKIIRWVYNNATAVRALNPLMEEMLRERGIKNRIVIIQNRANLKLFQPRKEEYAVKEEYRLIAVGSFVPLKGHQLLIDLVKKLQLEYPNIKLTLVGGGPLKEEYIRATENSLAFEIVDNVPQDTLVKYLRNSDIFLHPSYSEAVPRAIIEAMAMGLPIIASDAGMTAGLIRDGDNGMLFPVGNKEVLEQKLRALLEDEALRRKIGINAYKDAVNNYDWDKNFQKYREVIKEMML